MRLTTILGASLELNLEVGVEVSSRIVSGKSRSLVEDAKTLGFIDVELS